MAATSASASAPSATPLPEPRTLRFAWRPPGGSARAYAMRELEDQHRIVLTRGVVAGGQYPVVIAFHGQPRRGQAPREYVFPKTVTERTLELVESGEVEPVVLVVPVFRFQGVNWPDFDLERFSAEVARLLAAEDIAVSRTLVFGHSGAAGCGGDGMNRAHRIRPAAVGFFDTCVGGGLGHEVRTLIRERIPTLIVHSVETAGFRPRQPTEYMTTFDFGKVYAPLGLKPTEQCSPDAFGVPLRDQPYRCAADPEGIARAFVVDTGAGQRAHDAVVPVALRYFLREYAGTAK